MESYIRDDKEWRKECVDTCQAGLRVSEREERIILSRPKCVHDRLADEEPGGDANRYRDHGAANIDAATLGRNTANSRQAGLRSRLDEYEYI